jgi:dTDP-4-dehydrorhamnose 3,5-epimerase
MFLKSTEISGCKILEHRQYFDDRGFFQEIFHANVFKGVSFKPIQVNHSFNKKYSLRGIHVAPFKKLITCITGRILDVCVDLRKNSPTYLKHYKIILDNSNTQLLIPEFCGHAFLSLEENTSVIHMQDAFYDPSIEPSLIYNSPEINIDWGIEDNLLIISEKGKKADSLKQLEEKLFF